MNLHLQIPAIVAALALAGLAPFAVSAQTEEAALAAATTDATAFARMTASSNMFEIESSRLALEKAQGEAVRSFAQKMIDDHTAAGEKFAQAARDAGVEVPSGMSEADSAKLEVLSTSEDFDKAYLAAQVEAHDAAVKLFEGFAADGPEGQLRDFAAETLPTLQGHQAEVHTLSGK
jgi:putative membrane protein